MMIAAPQFFSMPEAPSNRSFFVIEYFLIIQRTSFLIQSLFIVHKVYISENMKRNYVVSLVHLVLQVFKEYLLKQLQKSLRGFYQE